MGYLVRRISSFVDDSQVPDDTRGYSQRARPAQYVHTRSIRSIRWAPCCDPFYCGLEPMRWKAPRYSTVTVHFAARRPPRTRHGRHGRAGGEPNPLFGDGVGGMGARYSPQVRWSAVFRTTALRGGRFVLGFHTASPGECGVLPVRFDRPASPPYACFRQTPTVFMGKCAAAPPQPRFSRPVLTFHFSGVFLSPSHDHFTSKWKADCAM